MVVDIIDVIRALAVIFTPEDQTQVDTYYIVDAMASLFANEAFSNTIKRLTGVAERLTTFFDQPEDQRNFTFGIKETFHAVHPVANFPPANPEPYLPKCPRRRPVLRGLSFLGGPEMAPRTSSSGDGRVPRRALY